jgi:hypothetical protein
MLFILISLVIFLVYNITTLSIFGVPTSLSNTYYLYEAKKKRLGLVFPAMMTCMAFTLLPAWLELGEVVSSWSSYLNPLAFFACTAILFVGGAPAFRSNKLEGTVHTTAAIIAAVTSLLWCLIVCWKMMYVPIIASGLTALVAWLTKTFNKNLTYWLEMMAFGATFATVITQFLIL